MSVADISSCAFLTFAALLVALVAYDLLVGHINTNGLLVNKQTGRFSPERMQLLALTVAAAGYYFWICIKAVEWPPVPDLVLEVIGGSHLIYLGGKSLSALWFAPPR